MSADSSAVERFLYREARLMDGHRYDEWLRLWVEDGPMTYWVPCNADDIDPSVNVSIIHDNRTQLRNRITRMNETLWLREQAPRLRRLVSNLEIEEDNSGGLTVRSNFILAELHRREQYLWAGTSIHQLVYAAEDLRIRYKKVMLINNDEAIHNLMFLI